jgi:hypothetical protein
MAQKSSISHAIILIVMLGLLPLALGLFPIPSWSQTQAPSQFSSPAPIPPSTSLSDSNPGATAGEPLAGELPLDISYNAAVPDLSAAYLKNQNKKKKDSEEGEQTKRMMWVVPNFAAVSANTELPPMTARDKFVLAVHDSMDYSGFTWTAILAGQALATNSDPEFGHGIKAYGRYYWRGDNPDRGRDGPLSARHRPTSSSFVLIAAIAFAASRNSASGSDSDATCGWNKTRSPAMPTQL